MIRHSALVAAAVAAMTVAPGATVTVPTDFRHVVAEATLIVRGHVTDVRTVAPPGGRVETAATVAVDPQTGQTAISPPLAVGLTAAPGPVVHGNPGRRLMTTSEFESLVRVVM